MKTYRYTDAFNSVVAVYDEDGVSRMSMLASALPPGTPVLDWEPPPPSEVALQTIIALETEAHIASQRLYREAVLDMMKRQAASMGITEEQLITKNKGYRQLKAFNEQIEVLREQL